MLKGLPNFSRPAGAIMAQSFDAGLFFALILVILHKRFLERCSHVRVVVRGRERSAHWCVGMRSVGFDIET